MAFLSLQWVLPLLLHFLHPFYVSVTEINHNAKDRSLEISCKIFSEDLEETLKTVYKTPVDLSTPGRQAQNDRLIADYIARHLVLSVEDKTVRLNYVGFEKVGESVYCYFEVPGIAPPKKMDLTNSILQDFTDKQINIVHVMVAGSRKSSKLDYPQKTASFRF